MKCTKCGYEFFEGIFCPECGTKYEKVVLDEKAVAEATERERKGVEEAAAEEAKKIIEAEKASIREKAEKEEREKAIKIAQEEAKKSISSDDEDIKTEASKRIREEAIQRAKEEEEKRQQEEAEKKAKAEKVINRKAIMSLVLGIISWVSIFTVIVPLITTVWSVIDGIKAIKGKTKHKKKAVIGIILSGLWWVLMIWIAIDIALYDGDGNSSATASTSSTVVDTEIALETDIDVENEAVVEANIEEETNLEGKNAEVEVNMTTEESTEVAVGMETEIYEEVETYTESKENTREEQEIELEVENYETDMLEIKANVIYGAGIQFFTIEDFPYQNGKKASKLLKVYQKAKEAPETDFVNVEYERKGIFDSSMQYVQTLSSGDYTYYGDMKNGKPNGDGVLFHSIDSPVLLGEFKDGQLNGYAIWYNVSDGLGVTSEGYYSKGELDGDYTGYLNWLDYLYDDDKKLKYAYEDYLYKEKEFEYDTNSTDILMLPVFIQEKGEYKNGKLAGHWTHYYPDGTVRAEIKYDRNGETGTGSVYYTDGTLKYKGELKGSYSNLQYHGKGTLYREDGSVEYKGEFKDGKIKT